eukprot:symbB.v1.2.007195.t1/scaffold436.1/size343649/27
MMLEQFVAEAKSARAVFHVPSFASNADKAFLPHLSFHVSSFPRIPDEESVDIPTEMRAAMGISAQQCWEARFRTALKADKFGTELNALITAVVFPFMVGKCEVQERKHEDLEQIPEGEAWNCAVKIEKCRWLERSGCVGMCVGLCKRPMQRMFGEVLGMPLSMEPNMEDLSCTMVFGKTPVEWEKDELREQPCFSTCATARSQGTCPKLT